MICCTPRAAAHALLGDAQADRPARTAARTGGTLALGQFDPPGLAVGGGGGRQLSRWDTRPRAVKTRLFIAVGRRRPDDYKERDKRRGKPCAASEITASPSPRARLTSGRGEVEAQAVGALLPVRHLFCSSIQDEHTTYHNWARQCPTAESAVYQVIPAGTPIHDPRSTWQFC